MIALHGTDSWKYLFLRAAVRTCACYRPFQQPTQDGGGSGVGEVDATDN